MLGGDRQLEEPLADRFAAHPAERLLGRRVHLGDESLVVDDHDTVECRAQDCVLAPLARRERTLGALARRHVDHQRDHADEPALSIANRAGRDVDVDQRSVAVVATEVEIAQHLAGRLDALEVPEEEVLLAVGDDGADAADHLFRRPAEHLRCAGVPRAHAPVEVEVDDRDGRGLDQRALVLMRLLDQLELRGLLERRHRLVRERPQNAQALRLGEQPVLRVVRPDVADAAATVEEGHEEPVVAPGMPAAAVQLRPVAVRAFGHELGGFFAGEQQALLDELARQQPLDLLCAQRLAEVLPRLEAGLGDGLVGSRVAIEQLHGDLLEAERLRDRLRHVLQELVGVV